jgi:hypothetical protein
LSKLLQLAIAIRRLFSTKTKKEEQDPAPDPALDINEYKPFPYSNPETPGLLRVGFGVYKYNTIPQPLNKRRISHPSSGTAVYLLRQQPSLGHHREQQ